MTSPPDKFFRDHLGPFEKPAPDTAWDRIATGLDRRRTVRIWMKAAAGIALLMTMAYLTWPDQNTPVMATSSDHGTPETQQTLAMPDPPIVTVPQTPSKGMEAIDPDPVKPRKKTSRTADNMTSVSDQIHIPIVTMAEPPAVVNDATDASWPLVGNVLEHHEVTNEPDGKLTQPEVRTTLVYSVQDVSTRFLKDAPTPDATSNAKPSSGLKKVIDIAADIKYEDNPLGDLRQKKNEILSLAFLDRKNEADK